MAEKLPPDATLVDAIYQLKFRQTVEEGLASLDRGERVPIEQVKAKIAEGAGKLSSRRLRGLPGGCPAPCTE